ncbi:MAG TPA: PAS domain S-box protein [Terriglobia bacterium]|nr:PAS domain S-box protein [Terriglobia bacterium]
MATQTRPKSGAAAAALSLHSFSAIQDERSASQSIEIARPRSGHDRRKHIVQFYHDDAFLLDALGRYIGSALCAGEAAIVIATKNHRNELEKHLMARGLRLAAIRKHGRYVSLDAAKALSLFMVDGRPDESRFAHVMSDIIEHASASAEPDQPQVAVYGEMVSLLWAQEQREAAIQVEKLWNLLAQDYPFRLCCGYPLGYFDRKEDSAPFFAVCAEHSSVIPGENYVESATEDARLRNIATLQQRSQALDHETALRHSEERFRLLVDCVQDYAIFLLDDEGRVNSWNRGAERIKGYSASEIIGRHFSVFYPAEDDRAGKPAILLRKAAAEGSVHDEGWRIRKDGSRFWAYVVITALRDEAGNLRGFAKVTRDMTREKTHEESLRHLTAQLLSSQDQERRRLARELHDSTAQNLTALVINLSMLQNCSPVIGDPKTARILSESQALADQAAQEIRNFSHLLHPPDLDLVGLVCAIPWFVNRFIERSGIQVDLYLPKAKLRLPQDAEIALFRIMQESLTNVQRHSGSNTATVRLEISKTEAVLKIEDQGCGVPPAILQNRERVDANVGVGLAGMQERMRQLGGQLNIDSGNQGTTVTASIPVHAVVS